ncbi:hypothetical protein B484DRAFT_481595 [Ochromonadaceae sp. CCMP2298]|nr:hypothetical protein B484DRAFT_481595 [Ochromonadaceae sp. CCMP2298]
MMGSGKQLRQTMLFPGTGSAVSCILWEGSLVAWADGQQVRVMDVTSQTALCQLAAPMGAGVIAGLGAGAGFPCSLCWQGPNDLLVGWADSFRHVRIHHPNGSGNGEDGAVPQGQGHGGQVATVEAEWLADCIICGLQAFDEEHVLLLGYAPPEQEDSMDNPDADDADAAPSASNQPEVIVASRATGEFVCADQLPMRGSNLRGPQAYQLLSSHQCRRSRQHASRWKLRTFRARRGGARGFSPVCFVVAPRDLVVVRVRDVNDRVAGALQQRDLQKALEVAGADRAALTAYTYADLLQLHLSHLLQMGEAAQAAQECRRLLGTDAALWESWVYRFIEAQQLDAVVGLVPLDAPRLPAHVYEAVLHSLLLGANSQGFLNAVRRWAPVKPELFDHAQLLRSLEQHVGQRDRGGGGVGGGGAYLMEAQAQLHMTAHRYEKALRCYLDYRGAGRAGGGAPSSGGSGGGVDAGGYKDSEAESSAASSSEHRVVFGLVERHNLFKAVELKVINLVRLSRPLAGRLLLAHLEKLPIRSVAQQLNVDKPLFLWYLHLLFCDPQAREVYSNCLEFADLHARQVQLYAEFAPQAQAPPKSRAMSLSASGAVPEAVLPTRQPAPDSDLLRFLKSGLAPLDVALQECERRAPVLHREMIYVLAQMGQQRQALQLLLEQVRDVGEAVAFVESQLDHYIDSSKRFGHKIAGGVLEAAQKEQEQEQGSSGAHQRRTSLDLYSTHYVDCQLWDDLVDFCLAHPDCLSQLLDHLGLCKLNPVTLLQRLPQGAHVPHLKLRVSRLLAQLQSQIGLSARSNRLQEEDTLGLLRRQNQGQRRAMKVDAQIRCCACSRPLLMAPGTPVVKGGGLHSRLMELTHCSTGGVQVWGPKLAAPASSEGQEGPGGRSVSISDRLQSLNFGGANVVNGAVIFSNKVAFHRACYTHMHS